MHSRNQYQRNTFDYCLRSMKGKLARRASCLIEGMWGRNQDKVQKREALEKFDWTQRIQTGEKHVKA